MDLMRPWKVPAGLVAAAVMSSAGAQALCSSDGTTAPTALVERFINADCMSCWRAAGRTGGAAPPNGLVIDWIARGTLGEEAPMAPAAARETLDRLRELGQMAPRTAYRHVLRAAPPSGASLRVARGPVIGGYAGASITLTLPRSAAPVLPLSAWLVLAEEIPRGTEGTPVPRHLVRNALAFAWTGRDADGGWHELRSLDVPDGTRPERLSIVGWVQDARGRLVAVARSRCG